MSERLKQIWSGFEETTSRSLTGGGVDKINVPQRIDWQAEDESFLPEAFEGPAQAAFAALKQELSNKPKLFGGKKKNKDQPQPAATPGAPAAPSFKGADELMRGLRATALRTERTQADYAAFLDAGGGKVLQTLKKGKKRFGLF